MNIKTKIRRFCESAVAAGCLLVFRLAEAQTSTNTLPAPPTLGGKTVSGTDPLSYLLVGVKWFIFTAFVILVGIALLSFAGGLIREVNEARQRGEWGKFGAFVLAGLFVVVVVIAAGWWGSNYLEGKLQ